MKGLVRRLLPGVFFCLMATHGWALTCRTVASCSATFPCDWNSASTWDCGRVPTAASGDTCVVSAGTVAVLRTDGLGCGPVTVNGTWQFDTAATGRDALGYRTFTVVGDLTGQSGGTLQMWSGHRLAFHTSAAPRVLQVNDGFKLDVQGQVLETTIAAITDSPPDAADCGTAAPGREFTITPAAGATTAHRRGRVVFESGRARNRHLEIRAVTAGAFRVCTDLPDATSGSNTTGGQRLTPHADRNSFCRAAGDPSICCTAKGKGTCPEVPFSRHSEPALYGSSACTGDRTPYTCCTGPGQGKCTAAIPAVGDRIAIVYDAWIYQVGGTRGYRIEGNNQDGNDPMPTLKAVNIANAGTPGVPTTSAVELVAKPGVPTPDVEFVNFHDYGPAVDGMRFYDATNFTVRWSAFHDVTPLTQQDTNATLATASLRVAPDNDQYTDNIFYRTEGVGPHLNEIGSVPATGNKFLRNIIFDTCLAGAAECGGLQGDNLSGGEAAYNLVYSLHAGDSPTTPAFTLDIHGPGAVLHHNWIVNSATGPTPGGPDGSQIRETAVTHNYISHTSQDGGSGGRWYSNVIRNFGLGSPTVATGIVDPIRVQGNYILGVEAPILATADCIGSCGSQTPLLPCQCGRIGIRYIRATANDNATPSDASDNVIASLASYDGFGQDGRCIEWDGAQFGGEGADANWDAAIDHLTCDGRGIAVPTRGLSFDQDVIPMIPAISVSGHDLAMLYKDDGPAIQCSPLTGVEESLGGVQSLRTLDPLASGGDYAVAADCSLAPPVVPVSDFLYRDHSGGDYNFLPGAPGLTAGSWPPGSPIGIRAFRFDRASLQSLWASAPGVANAFCTAPLVPSPCCQGIGTGTCDASVVTFDGEFPADIANVDNSDGDGDGVPDLHDNCPAIVNPDQTDADADGTGAACDCNDLDPVAYPGATELCNGLDDDCNGIIDDGPGGLDVDNDRVSGACDVCPSVFNPDQADTDGDGQGDACDLNDGVIYILMPDKTSVAWQLEAGYGTFNEYRGDIAVLASTGVYTQNPATTPYAARHCGLPGTTLLDDPNPPRGKGLFYLVTGTAGGVEGSLGTDSSGALRPNTFPCVAP